MVAGEVNPVAGNKWRYYWIKVFIGFIVLVALIVYALDRNDTALAFIALKKIRLAWVIPFAITFYLGYYFRAVRWGYLLGGTAYVPFSTLFTSIAVGSMFNMLLPLKSGEIVRAYILKVKNDMSYSHSVPSIALDRIYDLLPVLLSFFYLLFDVGVRGIAPSGAGKSLMTFSTAAIGSIIMVAIITGYFMFFNKSHAINGDDEVVPIWRKFVLDFRKVVAGQNIYKAVTHSIGIWLIYLGHYACFFLMAGYTPDFTGVNLLLCFTSLGILISTMPANVGTYHAAVIVAFGLCGIPVAIALGVAVFIHLLLFFLVLGMGLFLLWREGIRLKDVRGFVKKGN